MATIDIVILVVIGAGAVVGFMKGFVKQLAALLGLIVGLLAAKALYAVCCRESVFQSNRFNDSGTGVGVYSYLDSCAVGFCPDSLFADKGNGGGFARLAEPLVRFRVGSVKVSFAGKPANRRY